MSRKERWKRRAICLFIAIGGALALLAGPAAALLMIPKEVDWPVGGGIYWLNGTKNNEFVCAFRCLADMADQAVMGNCGQQI